ncbi:MAG TPA: hypothetical protein VMT89_03785 [Candidatus Acidoferrales bacterium]|nr:hypothetical protein [Candidatus Acidoferrales bacterium]
MSRPHAPLVIALAATVLVHFGTLSSGFHNDDYLHLWLMRTAPLHVFLAATHGGHVMVLPKLIMLGLSSLFGLAAGPHMALALALHLVNVVLLYRVIVRFGGSPLAAGAFAILWGASPSHQGVLSWMSSHGFILGTTTTLAAVNELARATSEGRKPSAVELLRVNLFVALGALSLGAASSVALVIPVIVWLLVPSDLAPWRAAMAMAPEWIFTVAVLANVVGFGVSPNLLAATKLFACLLAYGAGVAFAGPILIVTERGMGIEQAPIELASTASFVTAAVVAGTVAWGFARAGAAERRTIIGFLTLSVAMYGAVAVGRAQWGGVYSAFSLAMQDRYHYAPTIGMVMTVALVISPQHSVPAARPSNGILALAVFAVLAGAPLALADATRETAVWARAHLTLTEEVVTSVVRAQPNGDVYLRNENFAPATFAAWMENDRSTFPGIGAYWALAHPSPWVGDHHLRFVDKDPNVGRALTHLSAGVREFFASVEEAREAGTQVHSLDEAVPAELEKAYRGSFDPVFARAMAREFRAPHG